MLSHFNRKNTHVITVAILTTIGLLLLSINFYGLFFKDIRKKNLDQVSPVLLRFNNDNYISYSDSIKKLNALEYKDHFDYAQKANKLVQQSLTHVKWDRVDPTEFRQLIPIWENYLLYFAGRFSGLPQMERYHFVDYKRSLKRGIGICGDASMVLSQILDNKGIDNQIVSFQGHVITEITLNDSKKVLLDPDFGLKMNISLEELVANPDSAYLNYRNAGFSEREAQALVRAYNTEYTTFDNVYAFMSKRYIFEHLSYVLIWLIPAALLLISLLILSRIKTHN